MNINASIIDQRLADVQDEIRAQALEELNLADPGRLKSLAFVYLCVKTLLDLDAEETFDCLTDGGGDFGVDAMHLSDEVNGEFVVTLFQGKYKAKLEGDSNFEENGVLALINAIRHVGLQRLLLQRFAEQRLSGQGREPSDRQWWPNLHDDFQDLRGLAGGRHPHTRRCQRAGAPVHAAHGQRRHHPADHPRHQQPEPGRPEGPEVERRSTKTP